MSYGIQVNGGLAPLPNGWRLQTAPDGRVYYLDDVSQQTSWEKPIYPSLAEGWELRHDETGRQYFANTITQQTQWDAPQIHDPHQYTDHDAYEQNYGERDEFTDYGKIETNGLPSYNQALASDPNIPGAFYRTNSAIAGPDMTNIDIQNHDGVKASRANLFEDYRDAPPGYEEREDSASCGETCSRMGIGYYTHVLFTLCVWAAIPLFIIFPSKTCVEDDFSYYSYSEICSTSDAYIVASIMISIGYVGMVIAGCCSDVSGYLGNVKKSGSGDTPYEYFEDMKRTKGEIRWHVQCYHYKTTRNSKGKTSRKRVNTHAATKFFQYNDWRDVSTPLKNMETHKIMQLHTKKSFGFANTEISNYYSQHLAQWRSHHKRDSHQDFSCDLQIAGSMEYGLYEMEEGALPWYMQDASSYSISVLLSLGIIFRWVFHTACGHVQWKCEKEISGVIQQPLD